MFLRCIFLLSTILHVMETCFPTVPPEEYYPTASLPPLPTTPVTVEPTTDEATTGGGGATVASTTVVEDLCNTCDVDAIAPRMLQDGVVFEYEDKEPVDGCMRKLVGCRRTDDLLCNVAEMFGVNADSVSPIYNADDSDLQVVVSTITCGDDGNFFWGSLTGIEQITCNFDDC